MGNYALLIEYDGTAYGGWQIQDNSTSIQEVIENRLSGLLQERIKLIGAGRTDAGVHARGQVANFQSDSGWTPEKLMYALNGTLPDDIAVLGAVSVPDTFHARYDAISRRYSYHVASRKSAISRNVAAFFPFKLSVDAMNSAARCLLGGNNFRSFTKYADEQRHFICNITRAEWKEETGVRDPDSGLPSPVCGFRFDVEANRFLHGMVRAIVGTLLDVGRGKLTVSAFEEIFKSEDRKAASMSAPARGLFLEEVRYRFDLWQASRAPR